MKTINYSFGVDLNRAESLAQSFGGKVEGNFIIVPNNIHTGIRYFLNYAPGINALYIDATYNDDMLFKQDTIDDNYIGFYFDLAKGQADIGFMDSSYPVGKWHYDLIILDSSIKCEYFVKKGSKSLALYIFIRKDIINQYLTKKKDIKSKFNRLMGSNGNSIIRLEKMSHDSFTRLMSLQNRDANDPFFDLYLIATISFLISNSIGRLAADRYVLNTVDIRDLIPILNVQKYLFKNIDKHFPSIRILAQEANMSETKFKNLYKKITGETPNNSYLKYKLMHAKSLLEEERSSIAEISNQFFSNNAPYFSTKFKELFGIPPKEFVDKLK